MFKSDLLRGIGIELSKATLSAALLSTLLAGCSTEERWGSGKGDQSGFGSMELNLTLPNGEEVETVDMHLICPGTDEHHTLVVTGGYEKAIFGGLTPGACQVEMSTASDQGTDCFGQQSFNVTANETTEVTVTLICQGDNESPSGLARIGARFDHYECNVDRIKKVYAIPGSVTVGESTTVEVESWSSAIVGSPSWSFAVDSSAPHTGQASLSSGGSCDGDACISVQCTAPGDVAVVVTVDDNECFDSEEVWVTCVPTVPPPGSCTGAPDGTACDDEDLCTQLDTCLAGACVGNDPVTCAASDACHLAGTCAPATGECDDPVAPNATPCDDADLCTQVDACQAGVCVGASPVICSAGVDGCHPNVCNPGTGTCSVVSACELLSCGTIPGTALDGLAISPGTLENGSPNNRIGGFGSAIAYTGVDNLYVATPDRGPADGTTTYTDRYYLFDISISGSVVTPTLVGAATLNKAPGLPFVGHNTEFDASNSPASLRFDPEGVRVSPSGTLYVSDEYGPFLYEFDASGNRIRSLTVPSTYLIANPSATAELPPVNTSGRQLNRGMEGLAISPDGSKLYGLMQNALIQDGALNGSNSRIGLNNRILEVDTTSGAPSRELLYQLSLASYGTNEILTVNDHQFIVLERDGAAGAAATFKRLFLIDITGASDVSSITLPTTGTPVGVTPVSKTPFLDLLAPEFGLAGPSFPEKIEGLTFGPDLPDGRHVLIVTNDNDFITTQDNRFCAFAIDEVALPGFAAESATFDNQCEGVSCPASGACYLDGSCNPGTGTCSNTPVPAGTPSGAQTTGDCQLSQCNGLGSTTSGADNTDVPVDGNQCTNDVCTSGVPSNPIVPLGTPCTQGGGTRCNGSGACVQCNAASDCPGTDSECASRVCLAGGVCGFSFTANGTPVAGQTAGDCHVNQCDGAGNVVSANDNADVPDDSNPCTGDVCTSGVPSNPPVASGTSCGGSQVCDNTGVCVGCNSASDCPGSDTECGVRTCTANACGFNYTADGTPVALQTPGDCSTDVCNGTGGIRSEVDDGDTFNDGNQCTADLCSGGTPSNDNVPYGDSCTQSGGQICNGTGSCIAQPFMVLRVDGTTSASAAATLVQFTTAGATGTSVALPIAGASAFSQSGSASSEGGIGLSANGHYLAVSGYAAVPGTAGIASTTAATVNRACIVIDPTLGTSPPFSFSKYSGAFSANNVRGAVAANDGSCWSAGAGGSTAGIWWIATNTTGTGAQLHTGGHRWLGVFAGLGTMSSQLYGSSNQSGFDGLFIPGTGTPTTIGQTPTQLPGFPSGTTGSPFGFVGFNTDLTAGIDTFYVADDRAPGSGGGIQKWELVGGTWVLDYTLSALNSGSGTATGYRGLAGTILNGQVTLVATTTDTTGNRVVVFVDTGSGSLGTTIGTSSASSNYRGVALSPH